MFLSKVEAAYQVRAADYSDETYWTCFAFDDFTPDELHCTHKFFGEQTDNMVDAITNVLDNYFEERPFEPFTVAFTEEDFFGQDKDVRVLKPKQEDKEVFLLELRKELDTFADDRFPSYQPHITTDKESVHLPFTRYCLCRGDRVVKEYRT